MGVIERPADSSRAQALLLSLQLARDLLAEMESQPQTQMLRANLDTMRGYQALLEGILADMSESHDA
jgi:hypothetical protein